MRKLISTLYDCGFLNDVSYYKIKFPEASGIVAKRQFIFHGGYLYLPCSEILLYLLERFKSKLHTALNHFMLILESIQEDHLTSLLSFTLVHSLYYRSLQSTSLEHDMK